MVFSVFDGSVRNIPYGSKRIGESAQDSQVIAHEPNGNF
jgi:hypothetical protein